MKTMKQCNESKLTLTEFLQVSDEVDGEMVDYFVGCLPPQTMTEDCIQIGEPYDQDGYGRPTFITLEKVGDAWHYAGIKIAHPTPY